MASFADVVRFRAVSTGTGNFVVSSAIAGYQTPASAQMVDGQVYKYRAESDNLAQWECGYGVYTVSSTTLARTKILFNSAATQAAISFTLAPQVAIVAYAEDVIPIDGQLFGLTMSTAGASTTLTVAAGWCADSTAVNIMRTTAALAKTTSAWAVGTAAGGLDTGSIAVSTWYHFFVIKRLDTGVTDVLFSLSATAPTMPTNYTLFRRIGSMKTNASSQWLKFFQNGDRFDWDLPTADLTSTTIGTTTTTVTLSVPPLLGVVASIEGNVSHATLVPTIYVVPTFITQPTTPSSDAVVISATAIGWGHDVTVNASGQVAVSSGATNTTVSIATYGWIDTRGRLA